MIMLQPKVNNNNFKSNTCAFAAIGFFFLSIMKRFIILFSLLSTYFGLSHPMPSSVIVFDVKSKSIYCELQLPLKELQFAVPFDVTMNTVHLLKNHERELSKYILSHFSIQGNSGDKWDVHIDKMNVLKTEQVATGKYEELIVQLVITPKKTNNLREFSIHYDAILHQVVTHRALVIIRQDWENGKIEEDNTEIGAINVDINTLKVSPFKVNLAKGSNWNGFKSMVNLGMKHISEGTDHLLFLLVLLLSAPLLSIHNNWIRSGGINYALIRILKISTAFTIGHSITLIIGSFGLINPNEKLVEVCIALSIVITAIHAIQPIFPNKEIYVASSFGLIHGLAFATILTDLNLETNKLILSLLGFNIGIEMMQLFVIVLVMPWLLILSTYRIYKWIRIFGGIFAGIVSMAWAIERYTEKSNSISTYLENTSTYSLWFVVGLASFTIIYMLTRKVKKEL